MKNNVLNALHLSEVSYVGYNAFDMSELINTRRYVWQME